MSGGKRKPARRTSWREQDEGGEFSYRQSHWSDTVAAHATVPGGWLHPALRAARFPEGPFGQTR
jgi:hypothetical protein